MPDAPLRHTPLHPVHAELGARFTEFAGWRMPLRYDSGTLEHHAVRTTAGLFDLSHMGQIEVTGPEAGRALDYALVGHLSALEVGAARYTMLCHDNGGILDDLVVYRLAVQRFLVVANAGNAGVVLSALGDRLDGYQSRLGCGQDRALIAVQGPRAAQILASPQVRALAYYTATEVVLAGCSTVVARTGYTGEDGFEVFCRADDAARLWAALSEAGAVHGLRPAGLACRDTLRLEAGMPLFGNELHVGVTPFEARLGRVVAFTKPGGFVGRHALEARAANGPVTTLVGLVSTGRRAARPGHGVVDLTTGERIGVVTSGAPSPTLGHPIALGYVPASRALPGLRVGVDIRGSVEPFTVTEPRFYTTGRRDVAAHAGRAVSRSTPSTSRNEV